LSLTYSIYINKDTTNDLLGVLVTNRL